MLHCCIVMFQLLCCLSMMSACLHERVLFEFILKYSPVQRSQQCLGFHVSCDFHENAPAGPQRMMSLAMTLLQIHSCSRMSSAQTTQIRGQQWRQVVQLRSQQRRRIRSQWRRRRRSPTRSVAGIATPALATLGRQRHRLRRHQGRCRKWRRRLPRGSRVVVGKRCWMMCLSRSSATGGDVLSDASHGCMKGEK